MRKLACIVLIVCALINFISCYDNDNYNDNRIVNGTIAIEGEFPYMVSFQVAKTGYHSCGGSILAPQWILTAAHCVDNDYEYQIQYGSTNLNPKSPNIVLVSKFYVHPDFNDVTLANDIALLKLKTPIRFGPTVKAVRLPKFEQQTPAKLHATVIGWGLSATGGHYPNKLQKVDVLTVSDDDCRRILVFKMPSSNICAGVPLGLMGTCTGDSGGPLMVNNVQVGIVSNSVKPCATPPYPAVYTEVSYFTKFIFNTMKKHK